MRRLGTKVATFVMAAALVGGAIPTVAFAAADVSEPTEESVQVLDAENEPVFLGEEEEFYYGWVLDEFKTHDEYTLGDAVQVGCGVIQHKYDKDGNVVGTTTGSTAGLFASSGWSLKHEVLYDGETVEFDYNGTDTFFAVKTGEYTYIVRLYDADNNLVEEKSTVFYVNDEVYCLALEAETTEVRAGDTVSVRAHITWAGEDVTDLMNAGIYVLWNVCDNSDMEGAGSDGYWTRMDLSDGSDMYDSVVLSGADFYWNAGDTEMSSAYGLDCPAKTYSDGHPSWAASQRTDTIEITFPEPGVYYISALCDEYTSQWTGVLDNVDEIVTNFSKRDARGVEKSPGWDVIRFVVTDAEEAVVPEETVSLDDSVPTADVNTAVLWILALLSGMVAVVAARKRIAE